MQIQAGRALDLQAYGTSQLPEDAGTSHFCVVDHWGNVVVSSETINTSFGSLAAVAEWGIILNNEMDDFASAPGKPNAYGLIQSERNAIAPGKRPLSSMCPTIVLKDDKPYLLIGASGGPRIITSVLNVLINVLDHRMTLEKAVRAPRLHHQWQPDSIFFDGPAPGALAAGLRGRGHRISDKPRGGIIQAIMRSTKGWIGASDPRKGGRPAGY
jgi:gamma-glutamyltranspeptidase/glutathione hydrolase